VETFDISDAVEVSSGCLNGGVFVCCVSPAGGQLSSSRLNSGHQGNSCSHIVMFIVILAPGVEMSTTVLTSESRCEVTNVPSLTSLADKVSVTQHFQ